MSRKARHNGHVRARVLSVAGLEFRRGGFEGAKIDALMAGAGLTRGAFYAHFPSKAALFHAAIREEDLFLRLLRGRSNAVPGALAAGLGYILTCLLAPDRLGLVLDGWSLAALMRDAARGDPAARDAYEAAREEALTEMVRGLPCERSDPRLDAALSLAAGAVATAGACGSASARVTVLTAAAPEVARLVAEAARAGPDL